MTSGFFFGPDGNTGAGGQSACGFCGFLSGDLFQPLRETAGVRLLRLGEGLEPFGELGQTFIARCSREPRIHFRVFVGLAFHCGLQVLFRGSDRNARAGIADLFEKIEVTERMPGFRLGGISEQAAHVRIAFDVGDACEIQIPAVGLRFARERALQVFKTLRTLETLCHTPSLTIMIINSVTTKSDRCQRVSTPRCPTDSSLISSIVSPTDLWYLASVKLPRNCR